MMADEPGMGSLVDERPDLLIRIPEAEERPRTQPIVPDTTVRWLDRREAVWVLLAVMAALIGLLFAIQGTAKQVDAVRAGGDGGTTALQSGPPWVGMSVPVPESYRTHTASVDGGIDALAIAELGAAQRHVGSVATADGPTIRRVFSDHAFSFSSPTGATVVAFLPYQAVDAATLARGEELIFIGTLMPVPDDFEAMVGAEAASVVGAPVSS